MELRTCLLSSKSQDSLPVVSDSVLLLLLSSRYLRVFVELVTRKLLQKY